MTTLQVQGWMDGWMQGSEEHVHCCHLNFCELYWRPCELVPENEPWHQETDMIHEAGVQSVGHLQKETWQRLVAQCCRCVQSGVIRAHFSQNSEMGVMLSYQYPEEEGELKRVLEEYEVDEVQDDPRPPEPEVLV